jgi:hypothetical protein
MSNGLDGLIRSAAAGNSGPRAFPVSFNDADTREALNAAAKAKRWAVIVYRIEDNKILMYRKSQDFPNGDYAEAVSMLCRNFEAIDALPQAERAKLHAINKFIKTFKVSHDPDSQQGAG